LNSVVLRKNHRFCPVLLLVDLNWHRIHLGDTLRRSPDLSGVGDTQTSENVRRTLRLSPYVEMSGPKRDEIRCRRNLGKSNGERGMVRVVLGLKSRPQLGRSGFPYNVRWIHSLERLKTKAAAPRIWKRVAGGWNVPVTSLRNIEWSADQARKGPKR
jgi:hypothetical protein